MTGTARFTLSGPKARAALRSAALAASIVVAYFVIARLGLRYATIGESISPVWPPTGLAIAALLMFGRAYWPAILVGAFLANAATNVPLAVAAVIAAGNTAEAFLAAYLTHPAGCAWRGGLDHPASVRGFVFLAVPVAALASAGSGVTALTLAGALPAGQSIPQALGLWWAGDVVGALTMAPLLLTWFAPARPFATREAVELALITAGSVVLAEVVMGRLLPPSLLPAAVRPYLLFPVVIFAALRAGPAGAALATMSVAFVAVASAAQGGGPFEMGTPPSTAVALLVYTAVLSVTGLLLGAVAAQRRVGAVALQDANESLRAIIDSSPFAICTLSPTGTVLSWNAAAERLYGWGADEVLGETFPAAPTAERIALHDRVLRGESIRGVEVARRRKDGTTLTINLSLAPLHDARGEVRGVLAIGADLTELRQLEAQYRQAQKVEAVGRLAGGIAHDFNNTLTAILSFSHLLLQDLPGVGAARRDAEEIRKAAQRAAALTRQLLAFSRQQVLDPKPLNLNVLVRDAEQMLRRLIGEQINLETALAPDLGITRVDRGQLDQVLLNLVLNARDAMPQGGILTIETANTELDHHYVQGHIPVQPGPYVLLAVSDTGIGMDAVVKAHLFEPFFTTKEPGKGTGLGLATVYGIVKQSRGHVWVYSEPGIGTTVKIYLPRMGAEVAEPEPEPQPVAAEAPRLRAGDGWETVLLAEDQEEVLGPMRRGLEAHGYSVLAARSGDQAIALAARQDGPIHLLVTDVVMPGMNGRDLAYALSRTHPDMRVLFVSGYPDQAIVNQGLLAPDLAFLPKPFAPDILARKVRDVLDGNPGAA